MKFGKLFGESITEGLGQRSRGSVSEATRWLERFHPLLRQVPTGARLRRLSSRTELVENETGRILPLFLFLLFSFFVLGTRLVYLTLVRGEEYLLAAEGNRVVSVPLYPERGVIVDRNDEVIADNRSGFRVVADPRVPLVGSDLEFLAEVLGESSSEVDLALQWGREAGYATVTLATNVSRDAAITLEVSAARIPGVEVEAIPLRSYPYPYEFAHVLGYLGEIDPGELEKHEGRGYGLGDQLGKAGLEFVCEEHLRGQPGRRVLEKDAVGRIVKELAQQPSGKGKALETTLDLSLQQLAYQALVRWTHAAGAKAGALVVTDVNTGEVLSLVSYPSFDPNRVGGFLSASGQPLFNRAVSGVYPPGSTFKLVTGSAALEEGVVNASTVIYDHGSISIGPWVFYNWQRSGFGPLTFVDALSWSSDIYFYTVAGGYGSQLGVGAEKLAEWARKYGLGEVTGIGLPSETRGTVPDPNWKWEVKEEAWFTGDTYHMGIGQGDVLLTPLQLNMVTAAIANGGKRITPRLVVSDPVDLSGLTGVASQETLSLIRQGMRKSMTEGPNRFGNSSVVAIAGKTGTAETPFGNPHSWFTAFAPYDNPQIAVTAIVEHGGRLGAYHPSVRAVKEVMEYWFEARR